MSGIALVTTSRADWNSIAPVAQQLKLTHESVFIVGPTSNPALKEARAMGFDVHGYAAPVMGDSKWDIVLGDSTQMAGLAGLLHALRVDLMVLCGDRHETMAAAFVGTMVGMFMVHIAGGDVTGGSSDEQYRHAITKLCHLHCVTHPKAAERVRAMGEAPESIFITGSPAVTTVMQTPISPRAEVCKALDMPADKPWLLVNWQPETPYDHGFEQLSTALSALQHIHFVAVGANADHGGAEVNAMWQTAAALHKGCRFWPNMPPDMYINAMFHCAALVGNSSSGFYEAPLLGTPVLNIGRRQHGRHAPSCVTFLPADTDVIIMNIRNALMLRARAEISFPYGDKFSAQFVADAIAIAERQLGLQVNKRFVDVGLV